MAHYLGDSVADAAVRWLAVERLSPGAQDARHWDLRVVAQRIGDARGRPQSTPGSPAYLRDLRRLAWSDLDPPLLAGAIAEWGLHHAPVSQRRIMATWSSFLRWSADQDLPVPAPGAAGLASQPPETHASPDDVGELVSRSRLVRAH